MIEKVKLLNSNYRSTRANSWIGDELTPHQRWEWSGTHITVRLPKLGKKPASLKLAMTGLEEERERIHTSCGKYIGTNIKQDLIVSVFIIIIIMYNYITCMIFDGG